LLAMRFPDPMANAERCYHRRLAIARNPLIKHTFVGAKRCPVGARKRRIGTFCKRFEQLRRRDEIPVARPEL